MNKYLKHPQLLWSVLFFIFINKASIVGEVQNASGSSRLTSIVTTAGVNTVIQESERCENNPSDFPNASLWLEQAGVTGGRKLLVFLPAEESARNNQNTGYEHQTVCLIYKGNYLLVTSEVITKYSLVFEAQLMEKSCSWLLMLLLYDLLRSHLKLIHNKPH